MATTDLCYSDVLQLFHQLLGPVNFTVETSFLPPGIGYVDNIPIAGERETEGSFFLCSDARTYSTVSSTATYTLLASNIIMIIFEVSYALYFNLRSSSAVSALAN
jgi:hypothetical protein